jgi:hypothetical protein
VALGGALLDGYGRRRAERAFAAAHPGCVLRIGKLAYAPGANRLVAEPVTLSGADTTLRAGRVSLAGVRWARVLWGTAALADALATASLEATHLEVEFHQALYGIRCARLLASVPDSELIAQGTELRTLVGDEEFFAAHGSRTTRFRVAIPECRVAGLAYRGVLQGTSYRARSVQFSGPSFDALVNVDRPKGPFVKPPLMVPEALAAIRRPLRVRSLSVTGGRLSYGERVAAGAAPGVLTFGAVNLCAEGVTSRPKGPAALRIQGQGDLMDAGTLKLQMMIPLAPPDLSLHYSGSLGAMDLTRLDAFLETAEHTRIKSGRAEGASFDIEVKGGRARGRVRAIYRNLEIALLSKRTGSEKGVADRVESFLVDELRIRHSNAPDAAGSLKEGEVNYTRKPQDEFLQIAWFALRSGILDVISHSLPERP